RASCACSPPPTYSRCLPRTRAARADRSAAPAVDRGEQPGYYRRAVSTRENRRALRVTLHVPTVVEGVDQPEVDLHENLARVYQRVVPAAAVVGKKFPGT